MANSLVRGAVPVAAGTLDRNTVTRPDTARRRARACGGGPAQAVAGRGDRPVPGEGDTRARRPSGVPHGIVTTRERPV
ncbi:hypothetical protein AB0465_34950 [Streptomyces griseoviridis]|uniref:hypothetical protein n=1 Tax=Streptomyces griseoviridis TaxID=45398 RepID=UPI00344BF133